MSRSYLILITFLCMLGISTTDIWSVSETYNMRVSTVAPARIQLDTAETQENLSTLFITKPLVRLRKNRNNTHELLAADLSNLIYRYKNWYARADGAFGYVRASLKTVSTKHTQADDVLLSVGYIHDITPRVNLTYTLVGGIPTHKDDGLLYFQFGTGHYGLGGQIDGIVKNESYAWIGAVRCVHFFKAPARVAHNITIDNQPADQSFCHNCRSVNVSLGNLTDVIISWVGDIRKNHSLEIGYNPTFSTNLSICPRLSPVLPSYNISNAWYAAYRYDCTSTKNPMEIGCGASYGFDIAPKRDFSSTRNMLFWATYLIKF